jgi:hypothetical protein
LLPPRLDQTGRSKTNGEPRNRQLDTEILPARAAISLAATLIWIKTDLINTA